MLQAIRDKAQGWIAWAIVILITIPFALWGIQEYLGVDSDPTVAEIDGVEITERDLERRISNVRENLRAQFGNNFNAEVFSDERLKPQVLEGMIDEVVLDQAMEDWNMRASDAQVRWYISTMEAFQRNGKFDVALYESLLRNQGLSPAGFELSVRRDFVKQQLQNAINNGLFVTKAEIADRIRLQEEKRSLSYIKIPATEFASSIEVSDEAANTFYQNNTNAFKTPERVKISYVLLDLETLSQQVTVNEEALQDFFEQNSADFIVPEERKLRHILINATAQSSTEDEAAALAKATELQAQLAEGADFAALAKENSDDAGSAEQGGDLGWVMPGVMVKPFEDAAFALNAGEMSDVIRTEFGFHVIQVDDVRGGGQAGYDEVRYDVEERYRKREAEDLFYDYAERLADTAYETPDSLEPAANAVGLTVQTSDWLTRNSQPPAGLDTPKVINLAFSEDVLQGNNSELIEIEAEKSVVIRVQEHEAESVKPLADVADEVKKLLVAEKSAEAAAARGKELQQQLEAGSALSDVAGAYKVEKADAIGRNDRTLPAEITVKAFSVAPPEEKSSVLGTVTAEGDYYVMVIEKAEQGDSAKLAETEQAALVSRLVSQQSQVQLDALTQSLRNKAGVSINAN